MRKQVFFSAMIGVILAGSPTQAGPIANVSTSAQYQTITDSDSDSSVEHLVPAEAHAYAAADEWDYAMGDAWAAIGESVKAVSVVEGADRGTLTATADAAGTTEWLITSDTLPLGVPVNVLIDVGFNGYLARTRSVDTALASASLVLDGGQLLYEGAGSYGDVMNSSGAWDGDFQYQYISGVFLHHYFLDSTDTISFAAVVGQTIALELSLETEVIVPDAMEDGAAANFFDSGSYSFIGAEDPATGNPLNVEFMLVPEPGTFLLFGLGGFGLVRRRGA